MCSRCITYAELPQSTKNNITENCPSNIRWCGRYRPLLCLLFGNGQVSVRMDEARTKEHGLASLRISFYQEVYGLPREKSLSSLLDVTHRLNLTQSFGTISDSQQSPHNTKMPYIATPPPVEIPLLEPIAICGMGRFSLPHLL